MSFSLNVFRAYDIRGIASGVNLEISSEFAYALGRAFVEELAIPHPKLVVGRDNRLTGEALSCALIAGLKSAGAEVINIGLATSPYFYFTVCSQKLDGGIEITASHNPKEFNGFKVVRAEAVPFSEDEIQNLASRMQKFSVLNNLEQENIKEVDFKKDYFTKLRSLVSLERKLKIVIDCGNGTVGIFAPDFFRKLGCEVVELFCEPDGNFPNHMPNPEDTDSLKTLQKTVLETKADCGIAFDGDGDRVGIVDERGEIILLDWLIVLLARDLLVRNPNALVIFDVKCSSILESEVQKAGGVAMRWKTGHSFIKKKMRSTGALLAGEVSGHIFFAENYFGFDDGLLAAAKIISIVSKSNRKLSEFFKDIPKTYTSPEIKINITDEKKFEIMRQISDDFAGSFSNYSMLDGIRILFSDGAWGLIRPSNTSPYLTLRFEADSEERLREVKEIFAKKLKKYFEFKLPIIR